MRRSRTDGFTLIELMIVVAIIGILAAIAIPNFVRFQLRTKTSEGKINLAGIRVAEASYFSDVGGYVPWSSTPQGSGTPPGQHKLTWPGCSNPVASTDPGFCLIGWYPEGDVYFNYAVATDGSTLSGARYWGAAESDVDNDGNTNVWGINMPDTSDVEMSAGPFGCNTVLDVTNGGTLTRQIGPCNNAQNGRGIF